MQSCVASRATFAARRSATSRASRSLRVQVAAVELSKLSAEQQAFLERKRSGSLSPAPAKASSSAPAGGQGGYSPEQLAFLERKRQAASGGSAATSSSRAGGAVGNSGVRSAMDRQPTLPPRYKYVTPEEQASFSEEQCEFLERKRQPK